MLVPPLLRRRRPVHFPKTQMGCWSSEATRPIYGVSQDKSSRLVLSGSADCSVRLWDKSFGSAGGTMPQPRLGRLFGPLSYYCHCQWDRTVGIYSTDRVSQVRL